jgi:hypothetical protein
VRTTRLARLAAEAEILLIRREIRMIINRAIYGAVAAVFGLFLLSAAHVIAYMALRQYGALAPVVAAAVILGVDLLVTVIFALLANGAMTDPLADEARLIRDQSIAQIKDTLTMAAVLKPAGRMLGRKHIYGLLLAALTARFLGGAGSK